MPGGRTLAVDRNDRLPRARAREVDEVDRASSVRQHPNRPLGADARDFRPWRRPVTGANLCPIRRGSSIASSRRSCPGPGRRVRQLARHDGIRDVSGAARALSLARRRQPVAGPGPGRHPRVGAGWGSCRTAVGRLRGVVVVGAPALPAKADRIGPLRKVIGEERRSGGRGRGRSTLPTRSGTADGGSMSVDLATADAGVTRMTAASATDPVISVVVSTARDLDDAAAARLLRWCEAQLHLLDTGRSVIGHLVVDLSHVHRASASAVAILDHARAEADRRQVGIHLVGAGPIMATCALPVRCRLGRWSVFPTLDAAHAALDPPADEGRTTRRAVDPDALVLTPMTPHDRLG